MPLYQCISPEGLLDESTREAGLIFPGIGQEQQWFEQNRARLTELGML